MRRNTSTKLPKCVAVFGACGGVGRRVVDILLQEVELLIISDRSHGELLDLEVSIWKRAPGLKVLSIPVDLGKDSILDEMDSLIQTSEWQVLDAIYMCAGYGLLEPYEDTPLNEKLVFLRCNLISQIYLVISARNRSPYPIQCHCISSVCGLVPGPFYTLYHVVKAGLLSQKELGLEGRIIVPHIIEGTDFFNRGEMNRMRCWVLSLLVRCHFLNTTPRVVAEALLFGTMPYCGVGAFLCRLYAALTHWSR
ncbi:Short chain dehydrogenase [Giardia muris]|uniref:Short chain dehydrogenase n=1 Tax=Giardia muris TaxID=5742 RepID=A0A4Z1STD7_GIAMU|nr:Short chain dehydrogenase [Giardia muris]|eukprot:TNJ29192.1 Short chain dehydrogenase [Giardia muris]